jgi:small-conductance mechanosensitive channel
MLTRIITKGPNMNALTCTLAEIEWETISSYWHLKLFDIGTQPVTVSQIVMAFVLLIIGLMVVKTITGIVATTLKRQQRINIQAAATIERLTYYALLIVLIISLMQAVGIPIASLAFLGGALAIGVGFGAQNILNNFISGLILLVEQPIRVSDMIEVDGHLGTIAAVNSRCTRVKRVDGIDVLVPNSKFLENSVINWTLTDDLVKSDVEVGLAYGSDVQLARTILMEIANAESRIVQIDGHQPVVFFNSFGDNSLVFNLYFWMRANHVGQVVGLRSDLRFEIDKRFREANICIAFPQRDVHLDTLKPLEIKMIQGA